MWRFFAVILGIVATILLILAVAEYYAYFPSTLLDNLTYGELGTLAFVAAAGAVGCEIAERRHR